MAECITKNDGLVVADALLEKGRNEHPYAENGQTLGHQRHSDLGGREKKMLFQVETLHRRLATMFLAFLVF